MSCFCPTCYRHSQDDDQCDQIWQNVTTLEKLYILWLFFEDLFFIGQNFDPNWANCYDIGQIFIVVNGTILKR